MVAKSPRQTTCADPCSKEAEFIAVGSVRGHGHRSRATETKKADVAEHPEVFRHVGLLIDGPPGLAGLPFIQSSDVVYLILLRESRKANGIRSCESRGAGIIVGKCGAPWGIAEGT